MSSDLKIMPLSDIVTANQLNVFLFVFFIDSIIIIITIIHIIHIIIIVVVVVVVVINAELCSRS